MSRVSKLLIAGVLASACGGGGGGATPLDAATADGAAVTDGAIDAPQIDGAPSDAFDDPALVDPIVDLRADVDRDGVVELDDPADDAGEDEWTATAGAIFLANLDDDTSRCVPEMYPALTPDATLAACHDAADEIVNGETDLLDLARLKIAPWPAVPSDVTGTLTVEPPAARSRVRFFKKDAGGAFTVLPAGAALTAAELAAGVELAVEATDIPRDLAVWDGFVDVTLNVGRTGSARPPVRDTVRLRVAPIVFSHHLSPAERLYVTQVTNPGQPAEEAASAAFVADIQAASAAAGLSQPVFTHAMRDRWMQDLFETGSMTMPGPGGAPHAIRVALRSADVRNPGGTVPLRVESRVVFFLRGPDWAAIQEFDPAGTSGGMRTLDAFGNLETIPPYTLGADSFPLGRVLRGSVPTFHPDPRMAKLVEAQAVQPAVFVDTSWLLVAHVDETISFVPAPTPRGWVALVNDPALARQMLLDAQAAGHGDAVMFAGKTWSGGAPASVTISQVLADTAVMTQSALAAAEVEEQLDILKTATGLTDDEIIRVPFLHRAISGRSVAYQPGMANLLVASPTMVVAPDPEGPLVDGVDPFKAHLETALAARGITVRWSDVWDLLHRNSGEVHCGTNATRALPTARWWESGR
jgi:protein-arginine deiminase